MVTFIVTLILIIYAVFFTVLLILGKGRMLKRWFVTGAILLVSAGICMGIAIPVTSNKLEKQIERHNGLVKWYYESDRGGNWEYFFERYAEEIEWDTKWQSTARLAKKGFYWDASPKLKKELKDINLLDWNELKEFYQIKQ